MTGKRHQAISNRSVNKLFGILRKLKIHAECGRAKDDTVYEPLLGPKRSINARIYVDSISLKGLLLDKKDIKYKAISFLAHELGHFLVVPPQRRRRKDYGIPRIMSSPLKYETEEIKACLLQNEIMRKLGIQQRTIKSEIAFLRRNFYRREFPSGIQKWWRLEGQQIVDDLFDSEKLNEKPSRQ